jgi:hypothetical protein
MMIVTDVDDRIGCLRNEAATGERDVCLEPHACPKREVS